jgi:hypothetical protein
VIAPAAVPRERPRRRRPRLACAVVALLGVPLLASCAGVPTASEPHIVEPVPPGGLSSEPDVRYLPISPDPGEAPIDVVRDFLAAAGSPERQHGIARQYLTPRAAAEWRDDAGATVLTSQPYLEERGGGSEVTIRADKAGRVDSVGAYIAEDAEEQAYTFRFRLQQVNGEWRIDNPPTGVILAGLNFEQAYRRLNVYFLDQTGTRVVPDPRWFSAPDESLPNLLLRALLGGPAASLRGAVRTALGPGVSLTSNVVPDGDRVRVYLSGLESLSAPEQASASAQIVWTLNQLAAPGVQVFDDGQPVRLPGLDDVQHIGDWGQYDPADVPLSGSGYFVRQGAVWTTEGRPLAAPAGGARYQALSVGISRDLAKLAVVGRVTGGQALYVGNLRGALTRRLVATSLSPPTWGPAVDEVWTVRDGDEVLRVPFRGAPTPVPATGLDSIGPIRVLRLSRDGARVAVVADQQLYVGAITRSAGTAIAGLANVAPGLRNVVDVVWSAADTLMVLTGSGASEATLWSVAVDGSVTSTVTRAGLPGPPSELAAAPKRPTLAVAASGIWRLRDPQGEWTRVHHGGAQADSAPTYPG